jgi:hypothetical protein
MRDTCPAHGEVYYQSSTSAPLAIDSLDLTCVFGRQHSLVQHSEYPGSSSPRFELTHSYIAVRKHIYNRSHLIYNVRLSTNQMETLAVIQRCPFRVSIAEF